MSGKYVSSSSLEDPSAGATDAADVIRRANTIVTGGSGRGKTAAFAVPALQRWCGPAIYLTTVGAYANAEIVKARQDFPLRSEQRRFRLVLPSDSGQDRIGTILVKVRDGTQQMLNDEPGLVTMLANELISSLTTAMDLWTVDASIEALRTANARVVEPLLILDDYWSLTPFLKKLLDAMENPLGHAIRLVIITQYTKALQHYLGKTTFQHLALTCPQTVTFQHSVDSRGECVLSGVNPCMLAELGRFEALVGYAGSVTAQRFRAYFETR